MKSFRNFDYYEILEIPVNATDFEIRQAYKEMLQVYNEESSVTYSLFSNGERKQILEKIERAFVTLIDKNTRTVYDSTLAKSGGMDKHNQLETEKEQAVPEEEKHNITETAVKTRNVREKINEPDHREARNQLLSKDVISGNDIRELREKMGVELSEIYEVIRINIPVLKALEEDNTKNLPSGIYVKYLLKQYLDFLGIDSEKIIDAYMKNINRADSNNS